MYMSTRRLQVLFDEAEFAEIRRIAKRHGQTVAEWVRQALRAARRDEPGTEPQRKLAAVREAVLGDYPVADIEQMLEEIESGYLDGPP
jgi:transposase-like protein